MQSPSQEATLPFHLRAGMKALRRRPVVFLALSWAIGTAAGYGSGASWLVWVMPVFIFAVLTVWRKQLVCLCAVFLFLSALLVGARSVQPEPIEKQTASLAGTICAEPRYYDEYTLLTLDSVSVNGESYAHRVRLYLYNNGLENPALQYGDGIATDATVYSPKGATGDGAYDTAEYLWRNGIALTGNASAKTAVLTAGSPSPMRAIMALRKRIGDRLDQLYPEHNALARALLLGDKSLLSDEEYDAFRNAGIVHLLAVSGLHVSVLAEAVRLLLRRVLRMPRKAAYCIVLPFLMLYAAVVGFPASILRAAICFALMDAAPLFGRPSDQITGLATAFLLLCWHNPMSAFDTGFQLSFCAMLGMYLIAPVLNAASVPVFAKKNILQKALRGLVQAILGSFSAALGTLPVVAGTFGGLTLWSLFANILAIPLTSAAMPLLLASLPVRYAAIPGNWCLSLLSMFAARLSALPEKLYVVMPQMPWPFIVAYAAMFIFCSAQIPFGRCTYRTSMRIKALGTFLLVAIAAISAIWVKAPVLGEDGLVITFIDVGQGDSALVNAQGNCYLIDTGESRAAANRLTNNAISPEALFLTHPDSDHAGAALSVMQAGRVKTVYLPECWPLLDVPEEIEEALKGCDVRYLCAGDTIRLSEDVQASVLHPPRDYAPENDNDASLVLLIEYGMGSALMMGDLADSSIDFPIPDCDVIKLAHHGSESSSGTGLLLGASPSAAILSVGSNSFGHPGEHVLQRLEENGIPYYRTDECGDITVRMNPNGELAIDYWLDAQEAG